MKSSIFWEFHPWQFSADVSKKTHSYSFRSHFWRKKIRNSHEWYTAFSIIYYRINSCHCGGANNNANLSNNFSQCRYILMLQTHSSTSGNMFKKLKHWRYSASASTSWTCCLRSMNVSVASKYTYIEKSCLINLHYY